MQWRDAQHGAASLRNVAIGSQASTVLVSGGFVQMADIPSERMTNARIGRAVWGDVLVGGLGLGLFVEPMLRNPNVRSLIVVESDPDVVALVAPYLPAGRKPFEIIVADVHALAQHWRTSLDCVHFDIWLGTVVTAEGAWPGDFAAHLREFGQLQREWAPVITTYPDSLMTAWIGGILRRARLR